MSEHASPAQEEDMSSDVGESEKRKSPEMTIAFRRDALVAELGTIGADVQRRVNQLLSQGRSVEGDATIRHMRERSEGLVANIRRVEEEREQRTPEDVAEIITRVLGYGTTVEHRGEKSFVVCDVPAEEMGDFSGTALVESRIALMNKDLPSRVYEWIKEHEIKHLEDEEFLLTYDGPMKWLLEELRASTHAFTDPGGFIATVFHGKKVRKYLKMFFTGEMFRREPATVHEMRWPGAIEKIQDALYRRS